MALQTIACHSLNHLACYVLQLTPDFKVFREEMLPGREILYTSRHPEFLTV